jgi:predicted metal-dependent peptidase
MSDHKLQVSKHFTPAKIDERQKQMWADTRFAVTVACPGFAHILYTMLNNNDGDHVLYFTKDVDTAATDGKNILANPDFFFALPLENRLFVTVHEILHCVLNHIVQMHQLLKQGYIPYSDGKKLPVIPELTNVAQDLCINAILVGAKTGKFKQGWLLDPNFADVKSQWADVYRKLYEKADAEGRIQYVEMGSCGDDGQTGQGNGQKQPGGKKHPKNGQGQGPGKPTLKGGAPCKGESFDEHLAPGASGGQDADDAAEQHDQTAWDNAIAAAAAAEANRTQGKEPGVLGRLFTSLLTPKVHWRDYIEGLIARSTGSGAYNFRRMDRRMMSRDLYVPETSGFGVNLVVVGLDTSGSISVEQIGEFLSELVGILDTVTPRKVIVLWCDAAIHRVDQVEDLADVEALLEYRPKCGGTDFRPVFDYIEENQLVPDAVVYLTDLMGSFPDHAPEYPTIWGSIYKEGTAPFGTIVDLTDLK